MSLSATQQAAAASAVPSIYNNPPYPLSIGTISFTSDESPDELNFELEQQLAVHYLIGGGEQVQSLGAQHKDVSWSGWLWDTPAFDRSRQMTQMAAEGKVHTLTFIDRAFDVVIRSYREGIKHQFKIGYTITVKVLRSRAGTGVVASAPSIDEQVQALYAQMRTDYATVSAADPNAAALNDPILNAALALDDATPLASSVSSTPATLATLQTAVASAQTYVNGIAGSALPTSVQSAALRVLNGLTVMSKAVAGGQAQQSVSVIGGTLYAVASQFTGDPSFARTIAQANGLTSLTLEQGVVTNLIIPPYQGRS